MYIHIFKSDEVGTYEDVQFLTKTTITQLDSFRDSECMSNFELIHLLKSITAVLYSKDIFPFSCG